MVAFPCLSTSQKGTGTDRRGRAWLAGVAVAGESSLLASPHERLNRPGEPSVGKAAQIISGRSTERPRKSLPCLFLPVLFGTPEHIPPTLDTSQRVQGPNGSLVPFAAVRETSCCKLTGSAVGQLGL